MLQIKQEIESNIFITKPIEIPPCSSFTHYFYIVDVLITISNVEMEEIKEENVSNIFMKLVEISPMSSFTHYFDAVDVLITIFLMIENQLGHIFI